MKRFVLSLFLALATVAGAQDTFSTKVYRGLPHALGLKRTPESLEFIRSSPKRFTLNSRSVVSVPKLVDLTPLVSPPENQGGCGSCWDFSLTKALRSAFMLAGKDPGTLAFNYLLNNCGPGPSMWGCNGGDFDAAKSLVGGAGPWLESQDPYRQSEGSCKNLPVAASGIDFKFVGDGSHAPTFQELAVALAAKHMLSVDVAVCGAWGSYSGGIFNRNECGANSINHMINLVGYDCETSVDAQNNCVFNAQGKPVNGDGFLKAMNNWGGKGQWGEDGYMRSRYGIDALATTALYFEVKQDPKPAPTCSAIVSPTTVQEGGTAQLTLTSTNALSASIGGTLLPSVSGVFAVDTSHVGAQVVSVTVTGDAGQTAVCSGQYTVTAAPSPAGAVPFWAYVLGGLLVVAIVVLVLTRK
jgi:hypothetical protein